MTHRNTTTTTSAITTASKQNNTASCHRNHVTVGSTGEGVTSRYEPRFSINNGQAKDERMMKSQRK